MLGDVLSCEVWWLVLIVYFQDYCVLLFEDSQDWLECNFLCIFDSKDLCDKLFIVDVLKIDDFFLGEVQDFFGKVCEGFGVVGVEWICVFLLVCGFDYYCYIVFEFVIDCLGVQGIVFGGGCYDGLIEMFGGLYMLVVGWVVGIEWLVMLVGDVGELVESCLEFVFILVGEVVECFCGGLMMIFCCKGLFCDMVY